MGIKTYNPVTPGMRGRTGYTFEELTTDKPYRKLLVSLPKQRRPQQHGAHRGPPPRRRPQAPVPHH